MKQLGTTTLLIAAMAGSTCVACSDGNVDIGEDNPQASKTGLAAYAGSWDGYVEALTFACDTTDRVRLVLDEQGQGQIRFGERELIAKPTDPNVVNYPPQLESQTCSHSMPLPLWVFDGFNYPLQGSIVESARIRTGASSFELLRAVCTLQAASYPYRVYPDINGLFTDGSSWEVGYSITPVTVVGVQVVNDVGTIYVFEQAPTTVDQLTTNPMRAFPYADLTASNGVDPVLSFNQLHPDCPILTAATVESKRDYCARTADGTYTLDPVIAQTADIKLDGALGDQGTSIVGSLTLGSGIVRTVRLTRVQ